MNVTGVTITGGGAQTINAQNGFQVEDSTGTISGNTVTGIGYAGSAFAYSGLILGINNTDLDITNNILTGSNTGSITDPKVVGVFLFDDPLVSPFANSGGSVTGNTISFIDVGIDVTGQIAPDGITISGNTITDIDQTDPFADGVFFSVTGGANNSVDGTPGDDILTGGSGNDTFNLCGSIPRRSAA